MRVCVGPALVLAVAVGSLSGTGEDLAYEEARAIYRRIAAESPK